jgi:hypothetical protein
MARSSCRIGLLALMIGFVLPGNTAVRAEILDPAADL